MTNDEKQTYNIADDLPVRYVVKVNDKTYNDWSYMHLGLCKPFGHCCYFTKDSCFETVDDAKSFIKKVLKNNLWRKEADETWFEIEPVYFSKTFKHYITEKVLKGDLE